MLDVTQRLEIHELAARYGNVMDDRKWRRLGTLFTDDAVFSVMIGGVEHRYDGLEAIHEMLLHGRHPAAHHVTNVEVLDEETHVRLRFKVAGPGRNGNARDLDLLAEQWSADAWMGKQHGAGPDGVRSFFRPILQRFYRSIHMVVGHRIDLIDDDNATGMVYCRAEHESGDDWVVQAIVYQDTYRCLNGRWGFASRVHQHWYSAQVDARPTGPSFEDWPGWDGPLPDLPHAWPTWQSFWAEADTAQVAAVTRHSGPAQV